jgi:RimJ/RimL family protein N-acetyltransferase
LITEMQGKGLAEEAMRAALAWARAHGTGARFTCIINPDNTASLRVAAKLGFLRFAEGRYHDRPIVVLQQQRLAA